MIITNINNYNLSGTITSTLVLSPLNPEGGTPTNTTEFVHYGDDHYGDSFYEPCSVYQCRIESENQNHVIKWISSGSIKEKHRSSIDNISWTSWSTYSDAVSVQSIVFNAKYVEFIFVFHADTWYSTDYLGSITDEAKFHIFHRDDTIYATEINDNFSIVCGGTLYPRGGTQMLQTTSTYNFGDSSYKYKDAYFDDVYADDPGYTALRRIGEFNLSSNTTSYEFTFPGDDYSMIRINAILKFITTSNADIYLNNDSSSNYFYGKIEANTTLSVTTSNSFTSIDVCNSANGVNFNCDIVFADPNNKIAFTEQNCFVGGVIGTAIKQWIIHGSPSTLSSIKIISNNSMATGTSIKIWGYKL